MFRLAILAAIRMVAMTLLILGVCFLSRMSTFSSALRDYLCSSQLCWNGIYSGKTSFKEAQSILQNDSTVKVTVNSQQESCWTSLNTNPEGCLFLNADGSIGRMYLWPDPLFRLGDALISFGQPVGIRLCYVSTSYVADTPPMRIDIFFQGGIVISKGAYNPLADEPLTPNQLMDDLSYDPTLEQLDTTYTWPGFGWLNRLPKSSVC